MRFLFLLLLMLSGCQSDPDSQPASRSGSPPASEERSVASARDSAARSPMSVSLEKVANELPAPLFERPTLDGGSFDLSAHRGEVVLLNFWATWCAPCRYEIPDLIELQEEYGDDGLQVVGIALDRQGFEVVRPFAEEYGFNYPLVIADSTIEREYGPITAVPTTLIIGPEGRARYFAEGLLSKEEIEPAIEELLGEDGRR